MDPIQELRTWIQTERKRLLSIPPTQAEGKALLEQNTIFVDTALQRLYAEAEARAKASHGSDYEPGRTEVAIAATGGYGRRELSPFSDVDIAFIPSEEDHPYVDALIREAFQLVVDLLIDSTDLSVGYAFRPISDVPGLDHKTKTAILDSRLVAGDPELVTALRKELLHHLDPVAFLQEHRLERGKRDIRRLHTLEPDLKNGPGGLRDLHSIRWLAKVIYHIQSEDVLSDLERRGLLSSVEQQEISEAQEALWRMRNALHLYARKKSDVLSVSFHRPLAEALGFKTQRGNGIQGLMEMYYYHAEQIHQCAQRINEQLLQGPFPLGESFVLTDGRIHAVAANIFDEKPSRLIGAFEQSQRYGLDMGPQLIHLIEHRTSLMEDDKQREDPDAAQAFLSILRGVGDAAATLRSMNDRGLLGRYLPEFDRLMRHVPRDPSHQYTVGEHTLRVVERLSELAQPGVSKPPQFAEAMASLEIPEVLLLSALLHDAGKVEPGENHSETGAQLARSVGRRLRLREDQLQTLEALVRHHLLLMRTARLRDLNLPITIQKVADAVGTPEILKMLYLLSYADTRSVGEGTWTASDARLLDELYIKVNQIFAAASQQEDQAARADQKREWVRRELACADIRQEALRRHCQALPASYILNTPLGTIATHIALLDQLRVVDPVTDFYNGPGEDFTELTICTHDDPEPGLLSKIAGVLFAGGADVHAAHVYTLEGDDPIVLDTLWISANGRQISSARTKRLTDNLSEVLSGRSSVETLITRARKVVPCHVEAHVELRNDLSEDHTVVHVVADDTPGLLYRMTTILSRNRLEIHSAKIATWGGKAEDVYYVTRADGTKVPDSDLLMLERTLAKDLLESG